jgi:hypothetical protein
MVSVSSGNIAARPSERGGISCGTSASNGPGGGTEAVNLLRSTPQIGGLLRFWGAKNLSLMALMVPMPITVNLADKTNGPGLRRSTGAIGPPRARRSQ